MLRAKGGSGTVYVSCLSWMRPIFAFYPWPGQTHPSITAPPPALPPGASASVLQPFFSSHSWPLQWDKWHSLAFWGVNEQLAIQEQQSGVSVTQKTHTRFDLKITGQYFSNIIDTWARGRLQHRTFWCLAPPLHCKRWRKRGCNKNPDETEHDMAVGSRRLPGAKRNNPLTNFMACRESCRAQRERSVTVYCTAEHNGWFFQWQKTCHQSNMYCQGASSQTLNVSPWQGNLEILSRMRSHERWIHFNIALFPFFFNTLEQRSWVKKESASESYSAVMHGLLNCSRFGCSLKQILCCCCLYVHRVYLFFIFHFLNGKDQKQPKLTLLLFV